MNRKYEIGFIINPEAVEEDVKKITDSIVDIITKSSGIIESVDDWGRRRLAFVIQKHTEGIYVFISADCQGHVFLEIERKLKLTEKVMRFIVLRLDDKLKKANRLTRKWKRIERLSKRSSDDDTEMMPEEDIEGEEKEVTDAE